MKKIIVSVNSDLISDQRVHKMCLTLHNAGNDIFLVGRKINNDVFLKRPYKVKRFKMIFNKGFLFYAFFNIRLFLFLVFKKCDVYLSNDLDTLLANFLASKITKKPLVYDSHELFTEVPELINRNFVKAVWLLIERKILPQLKNIITVSDSIASFYNNKYKTDCIVIKNVPLIRDSYGQEKKTRILHFNNNHKNILYQGSLNKDRGIFLMIKSMIYINANLFLIGAGDLENELKKYVLKNGLSDKVFFIGRIPFQELRGVTKKYDLGLSFEEDTCLAYRFSLPNKIFDYIQSEVPVLVSNLPEMSRLVNNNNIGEVLKSRNPRKVALQINNMLIKRDFFSKHLKEAKNKFCWEKQESKVVNLFNDL